MNQNPRLRNSHSNFRADKSQHGPLQVDQVTFQSPVSIGDLLRFKSHVVHTARNADDASQARKYCESPAATYAAFPISVGTGCDTQGVVQARHCILT